MQNDCVTGATGTHQEEVAASDCGAQRLRPVAGAVRNTGATAVKIPRALRALEEQRNRGVRGERH